MKPITEIQVFVVQRDKDICYQTCRKAHKKPSLQVFELGVTLLKKNEDEPPQGVQLNGILAQMKGAMILLFLGQFCAQVNTDCLYTCTKKTPVDL